MSKLVYGTDAYKADIMRNPTHEKVMAFYEGVRKEFGFPYPTDGTKEDAAWGMVHKARVHWAGSTKKMVKESKAWLIAHGMAPRNRLYDKPEGATSH